MTKWYETAGSEGDIVISTRIRFARNLEKFPFPCKLKKAQRLELIELIKNAVLCDELRSNYKNLQLVDFGKLNELSKLSLLEKHVVSPDFLQNKNEKGYQTIPN